MSLKIGKVTINQTNRGKHPGAQGNMGAGPRISRIEGGVTPWPAKALTIATAIMLAQGEPKHPDPGETAHQPDHNAEKGKITIANSHK